MGDNFNNNGVLVVENVIQHENNLHSNVLLNQTQMTVENDGNRLLSHYH